MVRVETFPEAETPLEWRAQVREMQEEAWPSTESGRPIDLGPIHDAALRPLSMLLVDDDTVLAALDVLFKPIVHAGQELSAAGLSTVVTSTPYRGRGHGRTLIRAAREAMPALHVDVAVFTCDRPLRAFYRSCGWEILPGTVLVGGTPTQPFASDQHGFDKVTIGAFFTPRGIQVRESMRDARVLVYSGDVDTLW